MARKRKWFHFVLNSVDVLAILVASLATLALAVGQLLSPFLEKVDKYMDQHGTLLFMSLAMLGLVLFVFRRVKHIETLVRKDRILVKRVLDRDVPHVALGADFANGLTEFLNRQGKYDTLDIFAHTSNVYYTAIHQYCSAHFGGRPPIRKLRLFVRDLRNLRSVVVPHEPDKKQLRPRLSPLLRQWLDLKDNYGWVKDIEIRGYPFEPTMHFMVADGQQAILFGCYEHKQTFPGIVGEGHKPFLVGGATEFGAELGKEFSRLFDNLWGLYTEGPT